MKLHPILTRRAIFAVLSAVTVGIACPVNAAEGKPEVSKLSYGGSSWLGHYPVWVGIKKGIFEKKGLTVTWQPFGSSSARMGALMAGELDFAGTGSISALALMASGANTFYVVGTPDSYATVEGIIAGPAIKTVQDLKGKKLGVTFASSAHVLALDVIEKAGMDPNKDVTLINLPVSDMPSALKTGQVDAVAAWTPAFNKIRAMDGMHVLLDDTQFSLYKEFKLGPGPDVLVVKKAFADRNPNATKAFLDGIFEASDFISKNPDEAANVLMGLTELPKDEQLSVLKDIQWHGRDEQRQLMVSPGSFAKGMQQLADLLVKYKQIDQAPKVSDWLKPSLVP